MFALFAFIFKVKLNELLNFIQFSLVLLWRKKLYAYSKPRTVGFAIKSVPFLLSLEPWL